MVLDHAAALELLKRRHFVYLSVESNEHLHALEKKKS